MPNNRFYYIFGRENVRFFIFDALLGAFIIVHGNIYENENVKVLLRNETVIHPQNEYSHFLLATDATFFSLSSSFYVKRTKLKTNPRFK